MLVLVLAPVLVLVLVPVMIHVPMSVSMEMRLDGPAGGIDHQGQPSQEKQRSM